MNTITRIKYIIRIFVGILLGLYISMLIILNIPFVQKKLGSFTSEQLKQILKTEVSVGHVDFGFFNRIIVEDVMLNDYQGEELLKITRLSAKFEILPLLKDKWRINSIQLFGFSAHLKKETPDAIPNYQFVLDAFAPKDTIAKKTDLDLRINSIYIRRGRVTYDINSVPETPGKFNSSHIGVENLTASISLKALQNDTLNIAVRRFAFKEQSGFELKKLALKLIANNNSLNIKDFSIELPQTDLSLEHLDVKYDSLSSLSFLTDDLLYEGKIEGKLLLSDFSSISPIFKGFSNPFELNWSFKGKGKEIDFPQFSLSDNKYINIQALASVKDWDNKDKMHLYGQISQLNVNQEGIIYLLNNLAEKEIPVIKNMQFIDFRGSAKGNYKNLSFDGILQTGIGHISTHVTMTSDKENNRSYSGSLTSQNLNLGILLSDKQKFGMADFNVILNGYNKSKNNPESSIKGVISSLEYCNYRYENITFEGLYKNDGFNGTLALNDTNGSIEIDGHFNTTHTIPYFNIQALVKNVRPNELNLSDKYKDSDISLKLKADFYGNTIENLNGRILLDSLILNESNKQAYILDNLTITANQKINGEKELRISSSFMNALIQGDYTYQSIPTSIFHSIQRHIPALVSSNGSRWVPRNNFKFDIHIDNAELFEKVFQLPIQLHLPLKLKGYLNDAYEQMNIEGAFPQISYKGTLYESTNLYFNYSPEKLNCLLRTGMLMKSGAMLNLSLTANAKEDNLTTSLNWGNNTDVTYGGKFEANTHFSKIENNTHGTRADIEIRPTSMVLNDTLWHIYPSHIALDSGFVSVDNFRIGRPNQHLCVNGKISAREIDSCLIDLNNINVKYVLDILDFDDVEFGGMATGLVHLKNILRTPAIQTQLHVQDFTLNKALLGNADISGYWDNDLGGIRLEAQMEEKGISATHVTGYVSPKLKGLDLNIEADSMNLAFISPFVEGIFSNINARVNGNVRLYGPFKFLDFEGNVRTNFEAKIDVLNTYFQIKDDSIHVKSGELAFNDLPIYDREGHRGILNGYLRHNKLKNMMYRFDVDADNLLVYDSDDLGDISLYGRIYAIGDILVHGGNNTMNIDVSMTTGPNTSFTYVSGITTEATNNRFITFVDKTPKRIQDTVETNFYHYTDALKVKEDDGPPMDLYINMMVDATPDAVMKVVMDPGTGDNITARGNGNLQVNFYNKGNFRMFGNYIIDKGMYKLSMQEVIRKDFNLRSGGTVTFTGDPYLANLDLQAIHTVNSASLSDLSLDASLNKSTVKVDCIMNITGSLANPSIKFDLELPTVNEEDRELVRSVTSTEEQMNTQIIYLLSIGKFYTVDYANNSYQSSNATSSLAFNTLSGQLNNMLSQWAENKNWNIGANLSTGQEGWSDVEAEAILSGRLLNNRLLINGNFGYRENVLANTNFVGDFEAVYLLTPNGEFRLRGYNQTNDRYFTKSTLTTQGLGFIYKKDFNNWGELYQWLVRKKKKKDEKVIKD